MAKNDNDKFVAFSFCWADILFELDKNGKIIFFSGALNKFPQIEKKIKKTKVFKEIVAAPDRPLMEQLFEIAKKQGRINSQEIHIEGDDGSLLHVMLAGYILGDFDGHFFIAMRVHSSAHNEQDKSRWQESDVLDPKTFSNVAAKYISQADRDNKPEVGFISLPEMGKLKKQIDVHTSESFERAINTCLKHYSVGGDTAAQVSVGRYSILHDKEVSIDSIKKQIEELGKSILPSDKQIAVESADIEVKPDDVELSDNEEFNASILTNGLMYVMKRYQDKKDFSFEKFSKEVPKLMSDTVVSVVEFRNIVEQGDFNIALQPIIDVHTGLIHHYEALCRFSADSKNQSPYERITFGEEAGLIQEFDIAMIDKAIRWLSSKSREMHQYNIAVNISGHSIGIPLFRDRLFRILKKNKWTEKRLHFELTESSRMKDLETVNKFIQTIRKSGHQISLDDFGAGAASFQYLSALDVDIVKLDGSAIRNAQKFKKGRAFLTALTEFCSKLGTSTVAEMVDTPEGFTFIKECGCTYVQGYLFGKPSQNVEDFNPYPNNKLIGVRRL